MRNLLLALPVFFTFLLQAQDVGSKEVEPTLQVTKAFEKDFPKTKPTWRVDYAGDDRDLLSYQADFTIGNNNMTAVYSAVGLFKVLEIEIKEADIPANITKYMSKNYPNNRINKAAKVIPNNNNITYEIGITIHDKWTIAVFNKEGDFLKMVEKDR